MVADGARAQQCTTVSAQEVLAGLGVYAGPANDGPVGPVFLPPSGPIPPVAMPDASVSPVTTPRSNGFVLHDLRTGETRRVEVPVDPTVTAGERTGLVPPWLPLAHEPFMPRNMTDMVAVTSLTSFPWSAQCRLAVRRVLPNGTETWGVGSGTMIDVNTVLTAGHVLYNHGEDPGTPAGYVDDVYVFPAWAGTSVDLTTSIANFGYAKGATLAVGAGWVADRFDVKDDYAVVSLYRSMGFLTGTIGYAWVEDCDVVLGRTYNNASYPAEACGQPGLHTGTTMYYRYGTFSSCPDGKLQQNTTSGCLSAVWGGSSGSSAYYLDGAGNRYINGVASGGDRMTLQYYAKLDQAAFNMFSNTFIPAARGSAFDLEALNVQLPSAHVVPGGVITGASFLAANRSNAAASGTWIARVYVSSNNTITAADTLLSTQIFTQSFSAVSAARVNLDPITIPENLTGGTRWIGVLLDPATDGNSSNNGTHVWDAAEVTVDIAVPTGDACASAILVGEGTFIGTTIGSSLDGDSSCQENALHDVWYAYTASATGFVRFNTCGSTFDTVLAVHAGCPATRANEFACNDDAGLSGCGQAGFIVQSDLTMSVDAGTTYRVRVAGYAAAQGPYQLAITPVRPVNDACANALPIAPGDLASGVTGFAGTDGAASCGYSEYAPDVWYTFTPAMSGVARLETCGSGYDTVLSVHTGCPGTLDNQVGCNDDAGPFSACAGMNASVVNASVVAGQRYVVRVSGYEGHTGAFGLHYTLDPVVNETCENAIQVGTGVYASTTVGATTDGPSEPGCGFCCGDTQINQDVWFRMVSPCTTRLVIDTIGSAFDTKLAVYTGCPLANNSALACSDDAVGEASRVTINAAAGTLYTIRVGGFNSASGAVMLAIRPEHCACPITCRADFDCSGRLEVQDIFDFLNAWFAGSAAADFGGGGLAVQDIFDYLNAWFAGC
jgi:hypothetical protein